MHEIIFDGFLLFFGPIQFLLVLSGVFIGIIVGVLPGIGPMLGVILLTPVCMHLTPVAGMSLLVAVYVGGSCGGAISAVTLGIPGTPVAAATLLDGYPMAKKGKVALAVGTAVAASSLGGILGGIGLMTLSPVLASAAMNFGPPEFFSLALLGLLSIAIIAKESTLKGLLSAAFGLFVACVGTDPISGDVRFTFGIPNLMGGIDLIAMLVGMFAISEMFVQIKEGGLSIAPDIKTFRPPLSSLTGVLKKPFSLIRSSLIGTFIGALPAIGGVASSFISYAVAKGSSREPEKFGTGTEEGIVASEAANNACCGGALIPTLALSVPGDPIVAVLLGALIIQGLHPGPTLFRDHADVVGGLFYAYIASNIFLLVLGLLCVSVFVKVINIRKNRLIPVILLLSFFGTYAVQSSTFDIWCMLFFGVVGYSMRKNGFPLAPFIIARVLSPVLEPAFRRSLMVSDGSFDIFIQRPISLSIIIISFIVLIWAVVPFKKLMKRSSNNHRT